MEVRFFVGSVIFSCSGSLDVRSRVAVFHATNHQVNGSSLMLLHGQRFDGGLVTSWWHL